MITNETIAAIQGAVKTETITVNGIEYATRAVVDTRKPDPSPSTVHVASLQGIADVFSALELDATKAMVHIETPTEVHLVSTPYGHFKQSDVYATATWPVKFQTAQWFDLETFVVHLLSLFTEKGDRATILSIAGRVSDEHVKQTDDDGITQTVTVKKGIAKREEVAVPNPVLLAPFRTFADVQQPLGRFVFRMRAGRDGAPPTAALFEADGGMWRVDAVTAIKAWFFANDAIGGSDLTIVG